MSAPAPGETEWIWSEPHKEFYKCKWVNGQPHYEWYVAEGRTQTPAYFRGASQQSQQLLAYNTGAYPSGNTGNSPTPYASPYAGASRNTISGLSYGAYPKYGNTVIEHSQMTTKPYTSYRQTRAEAPQSAPASYSTSVTSPSDQLPYQASPSSYHSSTSYSNPGLIYSAPQAPMPQGIGDGLRGPVDNGHKGDQGSGDKVGEHKEV